MNLTDNEVLKFLRGAPVLLDDICAIYPVTLGEIVDIGYDKFQQYLSILISTKPISTISPKVTEYTAHISSINTGPPLINFKVSLSVKFINLI